MMQISVKTYTDVIALPTYEDRLEYLKCFQNVGDRTFGSFRQLNQTFYTSPLWKDQIRPYIIARDNGCDLAVPGLDIRGPIYVHHITPITIDDFLSENPLVTDPNNLICTSYDTHQLIHYGRISKCIIHERVPFDTCPWKGGMK